MEEQLQQGEKCEEETVITDEKKTCKQLLLQARSKGKSQA